MKNAKKGTGQARRKVLSEVQQHCQDITCAVNALNVRTDQALQAGIPVNVIEALLGRVVSADDLDPEEDMDLCHEQKPKPPLAATGGGEPV
jgi:hypothetical protein